MRTNCTLLALALLAGCAGSDEPDVSPDAGGATVAATSGEVTLLSYNVAGLPQELSQENPAEHLPLISPLLSDYEIVLTQEDFDWWAPALDTLDFVHYHERLRKDADHEYRTDKHPGPEAVGLDLSQHPSPNVGDGLGFLSDYPFDDVVRVPWKSCFGGIDTSDMGAGDCLAMKGFMVGTFELLDGVRVDIYTLHGEAGGSAKDQELQASSMLDLAAFMAEHSKGRAVILAGDTNLHTGGSHPDGAGGADTQIWETFLQAEQLTDACTALQCDEPAAIDKLAFRGGGALELTALSHRFERDKFVGAGGEPLSDHPALAVTLRWHRLD